MLVFAVDRTAPFGAYDAIPERWTANESVSRPQRIVLYEDSAALNLRFRVCLFAVDSKPDPAFHCGEVDRLGSELDSPADFGDSVNHRDSVHNVAPVQPVN